MVQKLNSEGICVTCNQRSQCLSFKNSMKEGRPVLYCEEFETSGMKMVGRKQKEAPDTEVIKNEDGDAAKSLNARGLCINCVDNKICKFPGFYQDVIFCQEYNFGFLNERESWHSHNTFANLPSFGVKNLMPGWVS